MVVMENCNKNKSNTNHSLNLHKISWHISCYSADGSLSLQLQITTNSVQLFAAFNRFCFTY